MTTVYAVLNAGSSSIKYALFAARGEALQAVERGQVEGLYTAPRFVARAPDGGVLAEQRWGQGDTLGHEGGLAHLLARLQQALGGTPLAGVGHRVVHGGRVHSAPVRLDADVVAALEPFVPLAPLHQPHNLTPIRLLLQRAPQLPQVACFDTAFHRSAPPVSQRFALPQALHDEGVQRYGFHGLSYEYIASVLPQIDARAAAGRTVVMHLGNGASLCALDAGRSIASTMGFTALDGLPMGTRCGAIDPGVILYLMQAKGMSVQAVSELVYAQSGLLGVSGLSADMRVLLSSDEPGARLAIELYVYRIRRELGSMAAALGGLDAIVFTAGIGENAAAVRQAVLRDAAWLGVEVDEAANAAGGPRLTTPASRVAAWVIPTQEELMIARHTRRLV
jgi:acetate kinase